MDATYEIARIIEASYKGPAAALKVIKRCKSPVVLSETLIDASVEGRAELISILLSRTPDSEVSMVIGKALDSACTSAQVNAAKVLLSSHLCTSEIVDKSIMKNASLRDAAALELLIDRCGNHAVLANALQIVTNPSLASKILGKLKLSSLTTEAWLRALESAYKNKRAEVTLKLLTWRDPQYSSSPYSTDNIISVFGTESAGWPPHPEIVEQLLLRGLRPMSAIVNDRAVSHLTTNLCKFNSVVRRKYANRDRNIQALLRACTAMTCIEDDVPT